MADGYIEHATQIIGVVGSVVSVLGILAAAWWFLATTKFKPRIQFELDCHFFQTKRLEDDVIAELQFVFENKGFVEHRMYNLHVSVHALSGGAVKEKEKTKELIFNERVIPKVSIVPPEEDEFYFVRPGARQVISHIVRIPKKYDVVRVTAGFNYHKGDRYPHTARRIFRVSA
jgi:hypothetical protein